MTPAAMGRNSLDGHAKRLPSYENCEVKRFPQVRVTDAPNDLAYSPQVMPVIGSDAFCADDNP